MRFNVRGYDSQYSDIYMNGIRLNDAMTGYAVVAVERSERRYAQSGDHQRFDHVGLRRG